MEGGQAFVIGFAVFYVMGTLAWVSLLVVLRRREVKVGLSKNQEYLSDSVPRRSVLQLAALSLTHARNWMEMGEYETADVRLQRVQELVRQAYCPEDHTYRGKWRGGRCGECGAYVSLGQKEEL